MNRLNTLIKKIQTLFCRKTEAQSQETDDLHMIASIEGQISENEALTLMQLAQSLSSNTAIVEIGSYRGKSTIALASGLRRGGQGNKVYAIDPHLEFTGVLGGVFGPDDLKILYRNIVASGVGNIVYVVCLPSVNAALAWCNTNVGFLFIDGDHSYEGVKADFEAWSPYVVVGGIVAFHDRNVDGVKKLLDDLQSLELLQFVENVDELALFRLIRREYGEQCVVRYD